MRKLMLSLLLCAAQLAPAAARAQDGVARPELVPQLGHHGPVFGAAYSPDSRYAITASTDLTLRLWDLRTGKEARTFSGHAKGVVAVAFSPDGRYVVSGSGDNTTRLWDVLTGKQVREFKGHEASWSMPTDAGKLDLSHSIACVAFSPDGRYVVSGGTARQLRMWEAATGKPVRVFEGHGEQITAVSFSPDGGQLAAGGYDATVRIWDVRTARELRVLRGHANSVGAVAFSPDGRYLLSAGNDKAIRLWDVATGAETRAMKWERPYDNVNSLAYSLDGRRFIAGSLSSMSLWDVASGTKIRDFEDARVKALALAPDGRSAISGYNELIVWEVETAKRLHVLRSHVTPIASIAVDPNGKYLSWLDTSQETVLWEIASGHRWGNYHRMKLGTKALRVNDFSFDGRHYVSGSALLDTATRKVVRNHFIPKSLTGFQKDTFLVTTALLTGDGRFMVVGGNDNALRVLDLATGKFPLFVDLEKSAVVPDRVAAAVSADGRYAVATAEYDVLHVYDVPAKQKIAKLGHPGGIRAVAITRDGRLGATAGRGAGGDVPPGEGRLPASPVVLWDLGEGKQVRQLQGHEGTLLAVAFSSDGRRVASGGTDRTLRIWDTATGRQIHLLQGHSGDITAVAFSADGRWVFSGSEDGSIRLWDAQAGENRATLVSRSRSGDWVVATPEGLFDGTLEGMQGLVGWRFANNDTAPLETFFNEFYHPGLLAEILAGKRPRPPKSIATIDRRQPRLALALADGQAVEGRVAAREVAVRIDLEESPGDEARANGSGVRDVRLLRNGSLVKVWRGDIKLDAQGRATLVTRVPIVAGVNRLVAYGFNRDNIKSADAAFAVTGAKDLERKGKAYVLAVGINRYANPAFDLGYAVADAESFAAELRAQQLKLGTYADIEVIRLLDRNATKAGILAALRKLGNARPEDAVIVFIASHGLAQGDRFYIIPHDIGYKGAFDAIDEVGMKMLLANGISDLELEQAFEGIDATNLLLVIDACNSGQALEAEEKRRGPMNSRGLAQLAYEKGIYILTAAQSYQAALEVAELGHGLLTYALVTEGLKTAAADTAPKDGQVLLREWLDFATQRVPQVQVEKMRQAREAKRDVAFVDGEEKIDLDKRTLQHPRVFYRREIEAQPMVVAKPAPK